MYTLKSRALTGLAVLCALFTLGSSSIAQASVEPVDSPFTFHAKPVIQKNDDLVGVPYVGETLEAKTIFYGGWDPTPTLMKYQWLAAGKAIKGATSSTYTVTSKDVGRQITARVVGSRATYITTTELSDSTEAVSSGRTFASTSDPTLTGTAAVGQQLVSGISSGWSAPGQTVEYSYQWLANGKAIKGATDYYFWVTAKQRGKILSCRLTGTAFTYLPVVRTSVESARVP